MYFIIVGGGCFKCGAVDHIAKDCTSGGPTVNYQERKYVLKDDNQQRGEGEKSRFVFLYMWTCISFFFYLFLTVKRYCRYDMVFDEDTRRSPQREKRHRGHDSDERVEKQKTNRRSMDDSRHRDREKRDSRDRHRQSERSRREYKEDELRRERYRDERDREKRHRYDRR